MIAKLEQFVGKLVHDVEFRAEALRDPERAVARFGLTGPERHGALTLCAQMAGSDSHSWPLGWWF